MGPANANNAPGPNAADVTLLLHSIGQGRAEASRELLELVYEDLRRVAGKKMADERPGQTLQPTALVHEAFLRLTLKDGQTWENRKHFFCAAAEAMRRILIERARKKERARHGGGLRRVDIEDINLAVESSDEQLLALDEALSRFAKVDPEAAELIRLRFFVGLSNKDASEALGVSDRTGKRLWAYARAWLLEALKDS